MNSEGIRLDRPSSLLTQSSSDDSLGASHATTIWTSTNHALKPFRLTEARYAHFLLETSRLSADSRVVKAHLHRGRHIFAESPAAAPRPASRLEQHDEGSATSHSPAALLNSASRKLAAVGSEALHITYPPLLSPVVCVVCKRTFSPAVIRKGLRSDMISRCHCHTFFAAPFTRSPNVLRMLSASASYRATSSSTGFHFERRPVRSILSSLQAHTRVSRRLVMRRAGRRRT